MYDLLAAATRYVIIYSSNRDEVSSVPYVRHRQFTTWVAEHLPDWRLARRIRNRYPFDPDRPTSQWHATSVSGFYAYERAAA